MAGKGKETSGGGRRNGKAAGSMTPGWKRFRMALAGLGGVLLAFGVIYCANHPGWPDRLRTLLGLQIVQQQAGPVTEEGMQIYFLDVGQGDSTLVVADGHGMLIDAGENDQGERVCQLLEDRGVTELDYAVGTHPHSDHIGGLDTVLENIGAGELMMPAKGQDNRTYLDVVETALRENIPLESPEAGTQFFLGNALVTVVGPTSDYGDEINDWSICLRIQYGERAFLFTGDAEEKAEADMLAFSLLHGVSLEADVMKAAHHGSSTGNTEAFLDAVSPEVVVVSCGVDNDYGHPHEEVVERVARRGCQLYRTDHSGTIAAYCDGKEIVWETER